MAYEDDYDAALEVLNEWKEADQGLDPAPYSELHLVEEQPRVEPLDLPAPSEVKITKADGTVETRPMTMEELKAWVNAETREYEKKGG